MTSTDMRARVLLSVQRALLGHIGTAVRAIMCRWTKDEIHVRTVFDGEINDDDAEGISEAETEVVADFPSQVAVCFKLERRDYPALIKHEFDEVAVFRRLESNEGRFGSIADENGHSSCSKMAAVFADGFDAKTSLPHKRTHLT